MVAPTYTSDYAGCWFPETKLESGRKATGGATKLLKGVLVRLSDATNPPTYVIAPTTAPVPGDFGVTVKEFADDVAGIEIAVKGPVTVKTTTELRRGMSVKPSTTEAGAVESGDPDVAGNIGKYMGIGTANDRDGIGAPTVPANTVVIIDLNYGVS